MLHSNSHAIAIRGVGARKPRESRNHARSRRGSMSSSKAGDRDSCSDLTRYQYGNTHSGGYFGNSHKDGLRKCVEEKIRRYEVEMMIDHDE